MNALSPQENIKLLIYQLDKEVKNLSESNCPEIIRLTEVIIHDLEHMQNEHSRQLTTLEMEGKCRIVELEEEISYLKELNTCQRMMMEDNLKYLKALEDKLNTSSKEALRN